MKKEYRGHLGERTFTVSDIQALTKKLIKDGEIESWIKNLEKQVEFDKGFKSCHEKGFLEAKDPETGEDATKEFIKELAVIIKDNSKVIKAIKEALKAEQQT